MLPSPWPHGWCCVPDAEANARAVKFPAVYDGVHVIATAIARPDQVDIVTAPGHVLEIPLDVWKTLAPFLTVAAHTRRGCEK